MSVLITLEYVDAEILGSTINTVWAVLRGVTDAIVWNPKYKKHILI